MNDWSTDPDWCAIALSFAHRLHHIGIDAAGNYYCRECSRDRVYILRDDEVQRLLLQDRQPAAMPQKRSA
jgi:hypothetical protein